MWLLTTELHRVARRNARCRMNSVTLIKLRVTQCLGKSYISFISFIMSLILLSRIFSVASNFAGDSSFVLTLK